MAETLLLSVFGMLVSPFITKLVTDSMLYLGKDVAKEVAEDLKDLETTILPQLELTILATKHSPPEKIVPLTKWLAHLKDSYIDAARILHKVRSNARQPALLSLGNGKKKKKLLKKLQNLKEVAKKANTFRDLLGSSSYCRPITSGNRTDRVFGRDEDRDKIIKFLLDEQRGSNSGYNYSVVRVVANMRGAGKTTLAQYVYNDSRVVEHFSLRMWLCLSQELDIMKVTKEMINCVTNNPCLDCSNLGVLQDMLKAELPTSGNIMVILDDVLFNGGAEEQPWGSLFAPFDSRGGTCKIVVTSCAQLLPRSLRGQFIEWSDLTPSHFQSFLRYHAFDDLPISNQQLVNDLSDIVNQIAKEMSEMRVQPSEAMFIGNRLYNHGQPDKKFWQATLKVVEEFITADTYRWFIS